MTAYQVATTGPTVCSRPVCPYPALPLHSGEEDHDDNRPPAPKYVDDGDNYLIVPITPTGNHDHGHDRENR